MAAMLQNEWITHEDNRAVSVEGSKCGWRSAIPTSGSAAVKGTEEKPTNARKAIYFQDGVLEMM